MNISENRKLGAFSLATLLVSAHYGLGFIQGTAEQAFILGTAGSLYAVSLGLGTIALLLLAKFYWTEVEQIWTLLGNRYGTQVKIFVGFMSWSSLIGIEAAQIIGGSFILKALGVPVLPSMVVLTILFMVISLLPMEQASRLFQGLLAINFFAMLYALFLLHGLPDYLQSPLEFVPSLKLIEPGHLVGISVSTILLILLDMECQQFVVQAKDLHNLYKGCLLAAILLLCLALLPSSVVIAAQESGILPMGIDGKEAIPFILLWVGGGTDKLMGIFLIMSLVIPALGVGSSVLRVQNKTFLDFGVLPESDKNRLLIATINALLGLTIALKGGSIINLIVSFNAVYVAAALVPFIAYLLAQTRCYTFSELSVKLSLIMSSMSALAALILTCFLPEVEVFGSPELSIMITGIGFGILGLLGVQVLEKTFPISKVGEEI